MKESKTTKKGSVLVLGGGVPGVQTALDLADLGYYVYLIEKSASSLKNIGDSAKIIHADIFELSSESRSTISGFKPKVITGWFIGSHPDDQDIIFWFW